MSDFERRLRDALGESAEMAPDANGLADGARRRLRTRRRRLTTVGAVVAVVAVAVPAGLLQSDDDGPGRPDDDPVTSALEKQRVTCGGASWPVAAMNGGVLGLVDDAEVRAAFDRVLEEAPMDAPQAIREQGADKAPYIALAEDRNGYTLGTGTWTTQGPGKDADVVGLERQDDGSLRMTGWGDCQLRVAIADGRSPVVVKAPRGGVDAASSEPTVMVNELQCTSARDPVPFLGEPKVVEDDERVLVTMTSEVMRGGADCQGNPSVSVTLELDEPIGDRELLDGGTWPPTPVKVTKADAWHTVEHEGALVDVPGDWEGLDVSGCDSTEPTCRGSHRRARIRATCGPLAWRSTGPPPSTRSAIPASTATPTTKPGPDTSMRGSGRSTSGPRTLTRRGASSARRGRAAMRRPTSRPAGAPRRTAGRPWRSRVHGVPVVFRPGV